MSGFTLTAMSMFTVGFIFIIIGCLILRELVKIFIFKKKKNIDVPELLINVIFLLASFVVGACLVIAAFQV